MNTTLTNIFQTKYYRFSIAWTRLMPDGTADNINQKGIDYYNKLINALLDAGKEVVLTRPFCRTITIYTTHLYPSYFS